MLKKVILAAAVAALAALLTPANAGAYGAAHYGYTHVGPSGVYHTGGTAAAGPNGAYYHKSTTAAGYGGGAYHAGYGSGTAGYHGATTYHYAPSYSGGAAAGYHYSYVR